MAGGQGMIAAADLEALFHPDLPSFAGPPTFGQNGAHHGLSAAPAHAPSAQAASAGTGGAFAPARAPGKTLTRRASARARAAEEADVAEGPKGSLDDEAETKVEPAAQSIVPVHDGEAGSAEDEEAAALHRKTAAADERHAALIEAANLLSPVPGGLNESALAAALARRPLLAARLRLLLRLTRAAAATSYAEAAAGTALAASAMAATAAASAAAAPDSVSHSDYAARAARDAAAATAESVAAAAAALAATSARGRGRDPQVAELEAALAEAEVEDPHCAAAVACRRQIQALRARGAHHQLVVLTIEVKRQRAGAMAL